MIVVLVIVAWFTCRLFDASLKMCISSQEIVYHHSRYTYVMKGGKEELGPDKIYRNGDDISLKLTISQTTCSDAAVYKCIFFYLNNGFDYIRAEVSHNFTYSGQFIRFPCFSF